MKITIDTQVDTHEDIKKVLQILTGIIQREDISTPIVTNATPQQTQSADSGFMSMFGDADTEIKKENAPDFSSFLNLIKKPETGTGTGSSSPIILILSLGTPNSSSVSRSAV